MKPISLIAFLGVMLMLGTSLLWFPDIVALLQPLLVSAGAPDWLLDYVKILPFLVLSILLIVFVIKLSKRGKREDMHEG